MFEYQGGVYPGVWVYDGSGRQVVGVRLYLTPGILSDPIPLSQVTVPGSTTGGIISGSNPPTNPSPGTIWYNSGNASNAGIPAASYGVWNGSTWVNVGSIAPTGTPTASATAPVSPTPGQIWQNTSGGTLSGVPNGQYAVWNGAIWVPVGTAAPVTGQVSAGVNTVNGLQGNVTLAAGTNITLTPVGQTITIDSTGGGGGSVDSFNGRTGAVTPQSGDYAPAFIGAATPSDVNNAIAAHVAAVDPHAQYLLGSEVYGSDFLAQATAPLSPTNGQIWRNTSGSTVAGVPAGEFAVWNSTKAEWIPSGSRSPYLAAGTAINVETLPPTGLNPTILAVRSTNQTISAGVALQVIADSEIVDPIAAYDPATGLFTVPVGYKGVWKFSLNFEYGGAGASSNRLTAAVTKNSTNFLDTAARYLIDTCGVGDAYSSGSVDINLVPGDVIRWYAFCSAAATVNASSLISATLLYPID